MYIDDINHDIVGIEDKFKEQSVRIFPNPINQESVIEFDSEKSQSAKIEIVGILGRTIANVHVKTNKGIQKINIGSHIKTKGTYFIRLTVDKHFIVKKAVLY